MLLHQIYKDFHLRGDPFIFMVDKLRPNIGCRIVRVDDG